jgi:heme exporter protein A
VQLIGDKLSVERGGRALFAGLSFRVGAGETLLVTGANGAGKTTLLRTIAGFAAPAAGRVALEGGEADRTLSEQCHFVGHANAIKGGLTVVENVRFWSGFLGQDPSNVDAALQLFGLAALRDIPAAYLSAGQKRRLGLARLLVTKRPIWLLDEPTSSLDRTAQEALTQVANAHLRDGGIVVAATHVPLGYARSRELVLGPSAKAA